MIDTMVAQRKKEAPKEVSWTWFVGQGIALFIIVLAGWINMQVKVSAMVQGFEDEHETVKEIKEQLRQCSADNKIILQQLGSLDAKIDDLQRHQK